MEEDSELQKTDIIFFLYGRNSAQIPKFHKLRYQFIRCMGWDLRVTREECEEVGGWALGTGRACWAGLQRDGDRGVLGSLSREGGAATGSLHPLRAFFPL